ncbi:methylated-DNA--[protein]-cysteine S-methyltransferase [Asticcacaulis sp. AND118]|uniref:methylated-DNA--[protein]-cysteine S-methyltransferase n=1 Tax=Asticcacaulis sp. AND118 TaxID=2840468 RepID=UPI001CFF5916|nr:methylated-DNA--[protein]-cysteine S-methyltransferase [Asticcacaulis sp. AND118]UDF03196.1 methylated-DNA--[protein]-cysteine S-methyltransferase [Asticcacaulis sp. AND118]
MSLVFRYLPSPVGRLTIVAGDTGLRAVLWVNDNPRRVVLGEMREDPANRFLDQAEAELRDYFAGRRTTFDVPLDFRGTPFQVAVWRALTQIPFGETRSYGDIARQLGNAAAVRAVGAANGRNPVSIIAPCHRVIGASGKLTGFAGGLEAKAWLLHHEARGALL